jgi:hypothetical protein
MTRYTVTLYNAQQGFQALTGLWQAVKPLLIAGHRMEIVAKAGTRSSAQNRRMWAMLTDLSEQVVWHGQKLDPTDWKTMCTAALKKQRVVPGIDGGFVVMGDSTREMTIGEMSDLMEFLSAFGIEHGVQFREAVETVPA